MLQPINVLEFRKKIGQILDETYYRKDRFLIKRKNRVMAALVPIEDIEIYLGDEDIEIYTDKRIKEFEKEDRISKALLAKAVKVLEQSS